MAGKSPVTATDEQRQALRALAASSDRAEADRARSILLTLSGWTSGRIAQAFGVREDTVRLWRSEFLKSGAAGLKTRVSPGPEPVKAQAALKVAEEVLAEPVANRTNWTLPRLITEIEQRQGVRISKSRLSVVLREKGGSASAGRGTR
jgi:transposase